MPAAVAAALPETTTPWLPTATLGPRALKGVWTACGQAKEASKWMEITEIEIILRIRVNSVVVADTPVSNGWRTRQLRSGPEKLVGSSTPTQSRCSASQSRNYYEVLTGFRFGARCSHGLCSYGLRRRSCKLDQYHGQPSDGHHYEQSSGPSRLYSDWTFRQW